MELNNDNEDNGNNSVCKKIIIQAASGSFAGAMGIGVGHPFDTLKTRIQVGKSFSNTKKGWVLIRMLYRGILPPLLTAGIFQSVNFSVYESCKRTITPYFTLFYNLDELNRNTNTWVYLQTVFLSGCVSGTIVSLMATPVSLIKVQLQVTSRGGVIECASDLFRKYGFSRFYRGYCAMFIMESYGRGVYLGTYEGTKILIPTAYNSVTSRNSLMLSLPDLTDTSLPVRMLSAAVAGCTSWLSIYPFDVIKSRMQMDISCEKYKSCADCFRQSWQEGGIRLMFRGVKYTLIRAAPVAATILPVYELTRDLLTRKFDS